jgi:gluconokinase
MAIISFQESKAPLVIAIDVGSSSVRAGLFDSLGRGIEGAKARIRYRMDVTGDGGIEIGAGRLVEIITGCLDQLHGDVEKLFEAGGPVNQRRVAAVAMCTFWHALMGVDEQARPTTPLYGWNDTRAEGAAAELGSLIDARDYHARTGCMLHPSYWPAKLAWLSRTSPDIFRRTRRWMSIGEYFFLCLFGRAAVSISQASATGLLDQNLCAWDEDILSRIGVSADQLCNIADDRAAMEGIAGEYARRWPLFAGAEWFPALGDGACDNIGAGCVTRESAALMIGTSGALRRLWKAERAEMRPGLWCYRADGKRFVTGGALSDGGSFFSWANRSLKLGTSEQSEAEVARMEPDGHGLVMLPFFSGERSTGWHAAARAVIIGMSLGTSSTDLLRAGLESIAYRFAAIYDLLADNVGEPRELVGSGAALLRSRAWAQIISDVIGRPLVASTEEDASSRGAALMALERLGAISDIGEAEAPRGQVYEPDPERHARYKEARARHEKFYSLLMEEEKYN